MGEHTHIHTFLYRSRSEQGRPCLPDTHHILMIAKDTERVGSQTPGADMQYAGQQFSRDLIKIGDHQQKPLRRCVGGGQCTCLQTSV